MSDDSVVILAGVRTPIASFRGSFASVSAVELATAAARVAIERSGLSPNDIEESFVGSVLTANCGQNVARQVAIAIGIPKKSQAVTINKVCSSSMKALALGMLSIKSGYRKKILVAGCENMSQVPFYMPRGEIPYGGLHIIDGIARDGLQDSMLNSPMGLCAEKSVKNPCQECEGHGQSVQRRQVSFTVPAGTNDKDRVRFQVGKNQIYMMFNVAPSLKFRRDKDDIHCDVEISIAQAVLGGTVKVPGIIEDTYVHVPPGTSSHTKMRLSGKGVKRLHSAGYGDQYIHIKVAVPSYLSADQRALMLAWAATDKPKSGTVKGFDEHSEYLIHSLIFMVLT
ncbi:thiolase protein [Cooperia oncophora]